MKLRTKLISAFLAVVAITLSVGIVGWRGTVSMKKSLEQTQAIDEVAKNFLQREIDHLNWIRQAGAFREDESVTQIDVQKDPHKCGLGQWYYGQGRQEAEAEVPGIADLLQHIEEPHIKLHQSAVALQEMLKKGKEGREEAAQYYRTETGSQLQKLQAIFADLRPKIQERGKQLRAATARQARTVDLMNASGVALGTVLALGLGIYLSLSLSRLLGRISQTIAAGASATTDASTQVSATSQTLAAGASQQAASLQETSASLEEMSSMIRRNSESAQKASNLAKQARTAADQGSADMQTMSDAMEAIKTSSADIAKIIKTIDEIAFQTNILALNAAVEAARAGEAGMGFAVVADEVRNLAQRSAQAAQETAAKIEGAIAKTGLGVEINGKVVEALNDIVSRVRQVDELVAEVAGASHEQTQGITQINAAVGEMDKVTQSNAASAEESAAAAEELNAQAETMKASVTELLQLVDGGSQTTATGKADFVRRPEGFHSSAKRNSAKGLGSGNGRMFHEPALAVAESGPNEIPMEGDFKDL